MPWLKGSLATWTVSFVSNGDTWDSFGAKDQTTWW